VTLSNTTKKVEIAPYITSEDLVIDISVDNEPLSSVRMPLVDLVSDYILYNQEMFSTSISDANKNEALALSGLLRLCAKRVEEATY
jgi:hypothetical protein